MASTPSSVRFIHSSDWQLGMTRSFLRAEAAARFAQARIDAIATLGRLAVEHSARFIVVAGDVFESNQLSRQTLMRTLDALASVPVPVFLLPGNHDPLDGSSLFRAQPFDDVGDHIVVLRDRDPVPVPGLPGVEVVGAPWMTRHPGEDLCAALVRELSPTSGQVRVAVAHGQVDRLAPDATRQDIIELARCEAALDEGLFHYLALGDRHSVTPVGDSGRIWYSGSPVTTAFDEVAPNRALLVDLDGAGACHVEQLDVGNWHFMAEQRAINDADDVVAFDAWLTALPAKERTAVKVGFEGSVNLTTAAALDSVMDRQSTLFASLARRESTTDLAIVPDRLDRDSVTLSGYAQATWHTLLERANDRDATAQDALRLFYRLSRQESDPCG